MFILVGLTSSDGCLYVNHREVFGNDVVKRESYLPGGGAKNWVDSTSDLPSGDLKAFYFYVHNVTTEEVGKAILRLQLYRPLGDLRFQLLFEEPVNVPLSTRGAFHDVREKLPLQFQGVFL